ncbi:DUF1830 domain-containing protein [Cyanobium sp. FACHB-13342]|uniref:DUF1830 domain-containing protein n=1 Tax=Cyanobium sp. FACHB-13342 TaxID=2692793 RepID=UPI001681B9C8|nr:DUF1830 domain-containing protein [Cyanobium sp. FACHB-13342]
MALLACGYRNSSDRMVILRCVGPEEFFLERVVFPFELLSFQCPPQSEVKIWTHGLGGPELVETIQTEELLIEPAASTGPLEALPGSGQHQADADPEDDLGLWAIAG